MFIQCVILCMVRSIVERFSVVVYKCLNMCLTLFVLFCMFLLFFIVYTFVHFLFLLFSCFVKDFCLFRHDLEFVSFVNVCLLFVFRHCLNMFPTFVFFISNFCFVLVLSSLICVCTFFILAFFVCMICCHCYTFLVLFGHLLLYYFMCCTCGCHC